MGTHLKIHYNVSYVHKTLPRMLINADIHQSHLIRVSVVLAITMDLTDLTMFVDIHG